MPAVRTTASTRSSQRLARGSFVLAVLLAFSTACDQPKPPADSPSHKSASIAVPVLGEPLADDSTFPEALAHRDPLERARRVAEILEASGPEDLDQLRGDIEAAPLAWGDIEYSLFGGWWARFDPSAALAYAEEELRLTHPRVATEILRMWGRMDPQAAVQSGWLVGRTLDAKGLHPDYVDALIVGWYEAGQPGLEEWIQSLDPSSKATAIQVYMRMKIINVGASPALEWSQTAPFDPDLRRLALASGLNMVARQHPKIAVEWLDKAKEAEIDTRTFYARIARGWAHHAPGEALDWLMSRDDADPGERLRAVADIARIGLTKDEKGLNDWIATHPNDAWVDLIRARAIAFHVTSNGYLVDWPELMERASRFVNEEQRKNQYVFNIQRWRHVDPDAAQKWLDESGKTLLGDHIQYVEQIPPHELEAIRKSLAAAKGGDAS